MKIILTSTSPSIDAGVDVRFGRSAFFIVVDPETMEWQAHANAGVGVSGGAGTLAAQFAADQHASAVVSGDFGPNAYNALQAAGISMYLFGSSTTVREAIERFRAGQLERVGTATGQEHPARG